MSSLSQIIRHFANFLQENDRDECPFIDSAMTCDGGHGLNWAPCEFVLLVCSLGWFRLVSWAVTQNSGQTRPWAVMFRRIISYSDHCSLFNPDHCSGIGVRVSDGHYPASPRVSIHHCPLTSSDPLKWSVLMTNGSRYYSHRRLEKERGERPL